MYIKKIALVAVLFFAFASGIAHAATLFINPASEQTSVGDTVSVDVRISSDEVVNAAQGTLFYPRDILDVDHVDKGNSVFDIWLAEPKVNTSTGEITFLGGSTNAFSGASMRMFTIVFKVRGSGKGTIGFKNAAITAGDGTGANILSSSTVATVTAGAAGAAVQTPTPIVPPPVQITRPPTPASAVPAKPIVTVFQYPDQTKWYNGTLPFLAQWNLPSEVSAVATVVDKNPQTDPTKSEGLFSNKNFAALDDGIWYLHVRFRDALGWGPTTHYRIAVDTYPPAFTSAAIREGGTTAVTTPTVEYSVSDRADQVAYYSISVDGATVAQTTSTTFILPALRPGGHDIVIRAFDTAGNSSARQLHISISSLPYIVIGTLGISHNVVIWTQILALIAAIAIGFYYYRRRQAKVALRVTLSEAELAKVFDLVREDVEDLRKALQMTPGPEREFMFKKLKDSLAKMQEYLERGLEKIKK